MSEQLVALTPGDLVETQHQLIRWCEDRVHAVKAELAEYTANRDLAKARKWRASGWKALVRKTEATIIYYDKVKAAIEAGYLLVPSFQAEVFAVRVTRTSPVQRSVTYRHANHSVLPDRMARVGDGEYVGAETTLRDDSYEAEQPDGKLKKVDLFTEDAFQDPAFPVPLSTVKPSVLQATDRAMALKIFDRIGVVTGKDTRDPIVVGQILDPRGGNKRWNPQYVTFFVAWFFDPRSL